MGGLVDALSLSELSSSGIHEFHSLAPSKVHEIERACGGVAGAHLRPVDLHQDHVMGPHPARGGVAPWSQGLSTCLSFSEQRYSLLVASDWPLTETVHVSPVGANFDFEREVCALDLETEEVSGGGE
jgi:hypothetical protein